MTDFDPARHKIVAVVTDPNDPDYGQHFHLSLPDLAREVHETRIIEQHGADEAEIQELRARLEQLEARQPAREVVKVESTAVEKLPQQYIDQLERIARDLERFKASQEFVMPKAFQEAVERISALEKRPIDITPAQTDTTLIERLTAVEGSVQDLHDNRDAHRDMIEAAMRFSKIAHQIMQQIDSNRARADGQYSIAMDAVQELSATIRRAIA